MDRNESSPGNVERRMDETPVDRGEPKEGAMLSGDQREGGYGYDRPVDTAPARDTDPAERSADRDGMHGASRDATDRTVGDQGRETTGEGIARDW